MNLIDAINSGMSHKKTGGVEGWRDPGNRLYSTADVLADWEILEPTATITFSQLKAAYDGQAEGGTPFVVVLARRLGLKP